MVVRDERDVAVAASAEAATRFDAAVHALVSLQGDPMQLATEASQADPGAAMPRCLQAYLYCYTGTRAGRRTARMLVDGADAGGQREWAHRAAVRAWTAGETQAAAAVL